MHILAIFSRIYNVYITYSWMKRFNLFRYQKTKKAIKIQLNYSGTPKISPINRYKSFVVGSTLFIANSNVHRDVGSISNFGGGGIHFEGAFSFKKQGAFPKNKEGTFSL